jgi:hypothetical protein
MSIRIQFSIKPLVDGLDAVRSLKFDRGSEIVRSFRRITRNEGANATQSGIKIGPDAYAMMGTRPITGTQRMKLFIGCQCMELHFRLGSRQSNNAVEHQEASTLCGLRTAENTRCLNRAAKQLRACPVPPVEVGYNLSLRWRYLESLFH